MEIICFCPTCGATNRLTGEGLGGAACRSCQTPIPVASTQPADTGGALARCPICGEDKLYIQKRFSQKFGCFIIAVGAAAVPWTYGLSLAACALLDLFLYRLLPTISVCYVCASRIAGVPVNPEHHAYDLMTAQTWEARAVNWRRRHDRSVQG